MDKKIAILRGINVGGKRKILMADLKSICVKLGLKNVKSYIQSGNLIFNSDTKNQELEVEIENAITQKFRFDVPVIVRTATELANSITNNPFFDENIEIKQLHLTFLKEKPIKVNLEKTLGFNNAPDQFKIVNQDIFICCAGKYHKSKLTNTFFEKHLKVGATTRNWKTVLSAIIHGF